MKSLFALFAALTAIPFLLQASTCSGTETLFTSCRTSDSAVIDIENDPDGFVFIVTRDSLARFDGLQTVDLDRENSPSLPYGINDLLILKDGTKFIATDYGLYSARNLSSGSITKTDSVEALKITSLAYLENSGLIFGALADTGIFSYSPADKKTVYYTKDNGMLPASKPEKLFVTADGTLLFTSGRDIFSFDGEEFRLLTSFSSKIRAVADGTENSLVVAADDALYTLKDGEVTGSVSKKNMSFQDITSLFTDSLGRTWIGTSNDGVFVLEDGKITDFNTKFSSQITRISKIAVDRDGDIWFASQDRFCFARCSCVDKIIFENQDVTDITIDSSGSIWAIGPKLGVAWFDIFGSENHLKAPTTAEPKAVFADSSDRIWTAYDDGRLFLVENGRAEPVERHFSSRDGIYPSEPTVFFEDSHGTVWMNDLAKGPEIFIFNSNGELSTVSLPKKFAKLTGFIEYEERIIAVTEKDGFFRYINDSFEPEQLNFEHTFTRSVFRDSENRFWITTPSAKLFIIIEGSDAVELPLKANSEISTIYSVAESSSGDFWLTTDKGFVKIMKKDLACFLASICDKIPARGVGGSADIFELDRRHPDRMKLKAARDGHIAMPTSVGLLLINEAGTKTAGEAPQIFLNYAVIDEHQEIALGENEEIRLQHEPKSIEIRFSTPAFAAPENILFEYTLDDETFTTFDRKILITEPSAGSRRLTLRARHLDADPAVFTEKSVLIEIENDGQDERLLIWIGLLFIILLLICITLWTRYSARRQRAEVQLLINENVHKLEIANNMLRTAIMRDPLTNLMNRRFLFEVEERKIIRLLESWQRGNQLIDKRHSSNTDRLYALLMIDIDHFKRVNDIYGHSSGDIVLKGIAPLLVNSVRVDDIVIRWGGEEFLVLLENIPQESALRVAKNIRKTIEKTPFIAENGTEIWVTVSMGISFLPFYKSSPMLINFEHALDIADLALYKSKETRDTATYVIPGEKIPENDEEVQKMVTTSDYAHIMNYYSYQELPPDNAEEFEI